MPLEASLVALAQAYDVATEYWDWRGDHVDVPAHTLVAVLSALGVDATTEAARQEQLTRRADRPWQRMLPPYIVARSDAETPFAVHVTHGRAVEVWIELEDGAVVEQVRQGENFSPPHRLGEREVGQATFVLSAGLPLGYHRLHARSEDEQSSSTLIVTPSWLGLPARLGERRLWGLATQLYSVASHQSWGVGDLSDLSRLGEWAGAEHEAAFVLVNPLHAVQPVAPLEPSPYLPATRRYANPLYLRVEAVPEYTGLAAQAREQVDELGRRARIDAAAADRIDRDAAWRAKRAALEIVQAAGLSPERAARFEMFRRREGAALDDFAAWCALVDSYGADFHAWPAELRHPRSAAVRRFCEVHEQRLDLHRRLQWLLDGQLGAAQQATRAAGMALGIVHDLAVGVSATGADAWIGQDDLARAITVGAPPDAYNQLGQDWTQPPWRPDRLAESAYEPFRQLITNVLRHAGGLRVDHIIGLFRLWWIPAGAGPNEGTYVRYDHEALIGILALEAHRADAVVIGEDLGTVEPWVRDYLRARGVLGTSVLWFEFDYDGDGTKPLPAQRWREYCLASVTTHDLPPTAGYLAGEHVRLRHSLGLLTRSLDEELAADRAEQAAWIDELRRSGALAPGADDIDDVALAMHRYLGWSPARLRMLSLTDAVGDRRTQNQPGTLDQYPNWRVPLSGPDGRQLFLEDVMLSERAAALAEAMRC